MQQKYPSAAALTVAANAIAVAIAESLTPEQQNVLGNLVTLVGASILSMAALGQTESEIGVSSSEKQNGTSGAAAPDVPNG